MRFIAVVAVVLACVGAGAAFGGDIKVRGFAQSYVDKQTPVQVKPNRGGGTAPRGNDSCRWAHDNECDDPGIGTGACPANTDYSDCRYVREGEGDFCRWARDGECDEPHLGTGACPQGSDRTDCGNVAWMRNQNDNCATAFNGVCEEPGNGRSGSCEARTDRTDCHGRERALTIMDHFFGHDDRTLVDVNEVPFRYMGRLVNEAGEACTATLIASNVIVTAAHCIHVENRVSASARFTTARGSLTARTTAYLIDRRFNYQRFASGDEIDGLDWALLRIDQPLGDRVGFAGVRNLTGEGEARARAAELYQAGYAWDTGDHLSGHVRCHMVQVFNDNTFAHECDTTRGDSGSAFLVNNGARFEVIGVDSSFRANPHGPYLYIAVSAAGFLPYVADFVGGRSGTPVGQRPAGGTK
ncbi:trypsin-like serine peptidase [Terricaulis sp.]|uniref:trypsin-like serine peptidase n=1 Tax=Terricaulis sp. TaxID=2768686 RepID=UPI003783B44A